VNGCQYIDTVQVDSLNPIADFVVDSPQFLDPLVYEGTEDVNVKITNLSQNFAQANNPNSDTIFQWNLYTNQTPNSSQNWFFTYDLDEKVDTTYGGEEIYNVCLVAKNFNDCKDTICKDVIVHDFPVLAVPNVFTPGSAPNNEFYFPAEGIQDFECTVFNRYGVQVYEFSSISDKWDGSHFKSGNPCSDGVYFYIYKAVSFNGKKFSGEGEVTLIRVK
ncbi:MAG: gliding motility-associated C-terminal domain-containing protein, partial [Crocinitomicaceae bacterium]